jgi:hypothetical protein
MPQRPAREGRAEVVYHPVVLFSDEPLAGDSPRAARTRRYAARVRRVSRTTLARAHVPGTPTVKAVDVTLSMDETMTAEGLRGAVVAAG